MNPLVAEARARAGVELGFSTPPCRLDYENFRTDYGIGLIGLHWVVQCMYLPAYRAARFNLAAAAEINEDRIAEAVRGGLPGNVIMRDWRALVERDDVTLVDCVFGHHGDKLHRRIEVIEAAAAAGKHLLIQKPVAHTVAMAEQMAQIARQAGIWLAVNQNCRYSPANFTVKNLLTPDRLGKPALIEVQQYWGGLTLPPGKRAAAWVDHMIHHADLIRWWVGRPCVSVYSRAAVVSNMTIYEFDGGTLAYHMENHSGVEMHETNIRVLAAKGLIKAGHNWNWHIPSSAGRDFVNVCTDRNGPVIAIPLPDQMYEPAWSLANPWERYAGPYYDLAAPVAGMMGTMGSLMKGIAENKQPDNHISTAIEALRMCLAAELSAKTGKPVDPRTLPADYAAED